MCGIAGILRVHPPGSPPPPPWESIPEHWLDILDDSIKHRGPDGAGRFRDRATRPDGSTVDVALVHRRLSIIDHAGGHQPMVSLAKGEGVIPIKTYALGEGLGLYEPGTYELLRARSDSEAPSAHPDVVAVVFNGCIYNHRELRKELQAAGGGGHLFSTDHSDTEVLVHGWREWGPALPERAEAMSAWAIWDHRNASLALARDYLGEKPLYFIDRPAPGDLFAFASSASGLLRLPLGHDPRSGAPAAALPAAASLRNWIRHGYDRTPMGGIGMVEPREIVVVGSAPARSPSSFKWKNRGQITESSWATLPALRTWLPPVEHIDELLDAGVRSRLESDVPVGCFLSGGIDSSLLALYARRHRPEAEAFTVRMPDAAYDETEAAAAAASVIGIRHSILDCHPDPASDLLRLIPQLGQPFGDSSLLPTHWVSATAGQHVRVALSGDGGDELFAGYRRYQAAHLFGLLGPAHHLLRLAPAWKRGDADPRSRRSIRARFVNAAIHDQYADLVSIFPEPLLSHLGAPEVPWPFGVRLTIHAIGIFDDLVSPPLELLAKTRVSGAINSDLKFYLPLDLLRKTDTASMAVPLEVRAPFLHRAIVDTALRTKIRHLMPGGQLKGLLRQVARKYFPPEIVDRPKMGFAIPVGEWFRSNYGSMRDLLLDHLNSTEPFGPPSLGIDLNMAFIRRMLKEHDDAGGAGGAGEKSLFPWKGRDHSQRLYMLLVLSIWAKWLGSLTPAAST